MNWLDSIWDLLLTRYREPEIKLPGEVKTDVYYSHRSHAMIVDAKMYTKGCASGNKVGLKIKGVYFGFEGLPCRLSGKESACRYQKSEFNPCVGKIPWRRKWQPTLVFLPRISYGQRILEGYSPGGCKRVGYDLVTKQQQQRDLG